MSNRIVWLAVPDVAERLGVPLSRVRDLLHDRKLLAVRRGENSALYVPEVFLDESMHGVTPHRWLHGTLTMLGDAGLDDDEAMAWMLDEHPELGASPIETLRSGSRAHVRRVAQILF